MKKYLLITLLVFILIPLLFVTGCTDTKTTDNADTSTENTIDTAITTDTTGTTEPTDTTSAVTVTTDATAEPVTTSAVSEDPSDTVSDNTSADTTSDTSDVEPKKEKLMPQFSIPGGIVTAKVSLSLSVPEGNEGLTIRYTLDGSIPDSSSECFTGDITVPATGNVCVVRAACFDKSGNISGCVATNTYIISEKETSIYTVSITAENDDYMRIVNNFSESIEVPAHVEIITPSGERVISQDAGLRIFGGSSRSLPQKSFKIIARKTEKLGSEIYDGAGSFKYAFFENRYIRSGENTGKLLDKYDSLILRNGGNDSIQATACDPDRATLLRDNIANNFAAALNSRIDYACSAFASVYVNGEYYGLLDMKENMDESYVRRVYGVSDDDVVIVKSELDTSRGDRFDGDWFFYESDNQSELDAWVALCREAINSTPGDFNIIYSHVSASIDLDSFIEYIALNLYICNTDWPHNNVKIWRYTGQKTDGIEITDGKWRFMTRDMDMAFGRYDSAYVLPELDNTAEVDTFYRILGNYRKQYASIYPDRDDTKLYPDSLLLQGLFDFCMKSQSFRSKFTDYCHLLAENSTDILTGIYNSQSNAIKSEIGNYLTCWSGTYNNYSAKSWMKSIRNIMTFITDRPSYFLSALERACGLYE